MRRLAFLVALACGCGSSDSGVSLENYPDRAIDNFCDNATECGFYPDLQTCLDTQDAFTVDQELADQEAGLLNPDEGKLAECAAARTGCERDFNTNTEDVERAIACIEAVSGSLADGEVCTSNTQCTGGICRPDETCDPNDTCCPGTCETGELPFSQSGEDCLFGPRCGVGLFCNVEVSGQDVMLICRPQVADGVECLAGNACVDGHWCNSVDGESPGTCEPRAASGESCDGTSATRINACLDVTTYCDGTTSACEPRPEAGESCGEGIPCLGYAYCDAGTCRIRPVEGEACDAENGPDCLGRLSCLESGVCGFQTAAPREICEL